MEYDEEDNGAAGIIPEFGAIFMSSNVTKKDCFKYKVFALPSSKAKFVKHIKTGMVLFLFEFETRKLFGVYQASSDGAMDIVPHAFNYSGRHFPAQVCFTPIWHCDPLSEKEFQDAIRDNYFSAKKFNFGLSEDQVHRLLSLFSSRKLKNKLPPHLLPRKEVGVAGKDRGFALSKRGYMESINYDEFSPATFSDYHVNSLGRTREHEVLLYDGDDTKGKEYPLAQGNFLSKRRRRMDNDDILITNDVEENIFDYCTLQTFCPESPDDSMDDEIRRLDYARRLLRIESIRNGEKLDRMFNHVHSSETSLDVRTADDDRYMHRNSLFVENNIESGSRMAFETKCYRNTLEKRKEAIEDERFLFDDRVRREEYNDCDIVKPMAYSQGNLNFHRQERELLESRYHLDRDGSPVSTSEYPSSIILRKVRKRTPDGRFLVHDSIGTEPNFGTSSMDDFSSENCSCQMHCGHRIIHDTPYPTGEGRVSENAGYSTNFDRQVVDGGRFRKSERLENEESVHKLTSPAISMEYPSFSKQKQNFSSFSGKLSPEKVFSQLIAAKHNFDCSRATFDDATITRAVPYSPENPKFSHGCSVSMADRNSSFVLENHPHHCSKHRSSPCSLDMRNTSISLDIAPEYANEVIPTNAHCQSSLLHEATYSFQNSNLSMPMNLNNSSVYHIGSLFPKLSSTSLISNEVIPTNTHHQSSLLHEASYSFPNSNLSMPMNLNKSSVYHRGSLFPKLSSASLTSTDHENIERENGGLFAYSTKSSESHFAFDGNLRTESHHVSEHVHGKEIEMLPGKDFIHSEAKVFICSEAKDFSVGVRHQERDLVEDKYFGVSKRDNVKELSVGVRHQERDLAVDKYFEVSKSHNVKELSVGVHHKERELVEDKYFGVSNIHNVKEHPEITEAPPQSIVNRRSVFARLTSRQESQVDEERQANDSNSHDCCMDATADEVIEMLQQDGQPKHGGSDVKEKQIIEMNHSAMEKKELNDICLAFPESTHEVPTETRLVDFKRRSDTKKKLVGTSNTNIIAEDSKEESSPKKNLKRKKLIRPVFGKTEPTSDTICSNQNVPLVGHIPDKDGKQSHERAVSNCKTEMPNDDNSLSNPSAVERDIKNHSNPEKQNDIGAHKQSPERAISNCEAEMPNDDRSLSNQSAVECNIKKRSNPKKKKNKGAHKQTHARAISNREAEMPRDDNGLSNQTECNIKEHSNPEKLKKDIGAHLLPPSTSHELIGHKTSNVGNSLVILKETTQHKSLGIETSSVEAVSTKEADATTVSSSPNLQESSSEVPKRCTKRQKKKIIVKRKRMVRKKVMRPKKRAIEPTQ